MKKLWLILVEINKAIRMAILDSRYIFIGCWEDYKKKVKDGNFKKKQ